MNYDEEIIAVKNTVGDLQKDVAEIKASQPFLQEMLQRNTEANEKLVATLHEVEKSIVSLNDKLDVQSNNIAAIKQEMDETNNRFDSKIQRVEDHIQSIDEEGKFNIRTFFKEYFPWIVVLVGVGINFISKIVSF